MHIRPLLTMIVVVGVSIMSAHGADAVVGYDEEPKAGTRFPTPTIKGRFETLDANDDGAVTRREIAAKPQVIRYMHLYDIQGFDMADVDEDGSLTAAEFSAFEAPMPVE